MQHQDTTIVADVRQDGHSGDKSIRLTLHYTQLGIASIPDLGIANDGLLAGRELESDAELLAIWGDSLNRKDRLAFGWVDPDESAIERANRTGRIGGKAEKTPIIDRTSDGESPTVDNRGFLRIRKPKSLLCVNFGQSWKLAFYRIVCNFGRVRELLKSPHSKEPDSGPRNIRKKSGAPRWKGHVEP